MTEDKVLGCLIALILLVVLVIAGFKFITIKVIGNKQIIDFNRQNFAYVSILADDGKWERHKIKAWKDWSPSQTAYKLSLRMALTSTHILEMSS